MDSDVIIIDSNDLTTPVFTYWYDGTKISQGSALEKALYERWRVVPNTITWRVDLLTKQQTIMSYGDNVCLLKRTGNFNYKIIF